MFDQVLNLVKEQLAQNPEIASQLPSDKAEAVHEEVAQQLTSGLAGQAGNEGGIGGLLSMLQGGVANNNPVTSAIGGGLVGSLASKFNLPPAVTGAIAAALPAILARFAQKANDPNDSSITLDSITKSLPNLGGLGDKLGGLFK